MTKAKEAQHSSPRVGDDDDDVHIENGQVVSGGLCLKTSMLSQLCYLRSAPHPLIIIIC